MKIFLSTNGVTHKKAEQLYKEHGIDDVILIDKTVHYIIYYSSNGVVEAFRPKCAPKFDPLFQKYITNGSSVIVEIIETEDIIAAQIAYEHALKNPFPAFSLDLKTNIEPNKTSREYDGLTLSECFELLDKKIALENDIKITSKYTINIENGEIIKLSIPNKGYEFKSKISESVSNPYWVVNGWDNDWLSDMKIDDRSIRIVTSVLIMDGLSDKIEDFGPEYNDNSRFLLKALDNKQNILMESIKKFFSDGRLSPINQNLYYITMKYSDMLNNNENIPNTMEENIAICESVREELFGKIAMKAGLRM